MLTQLTTLKLRLSLAETDNTNEALLTNLLEALHCRFDNECARTFARSVDTVEEFEADQTEILVPVIPSSGSPSSKSNPPKPPAGRKSNRRPIS